MSNPELTWKELLDLFIRSCPKDILTKINSTKDLTEKINICLQDDNVKKSINDWIKHRIKNNEFAKCAEKSTALRQEGNKIFAGPNPCQALDIYTKSILAAPEGSEELKLSYGNLSAVLFHLNKFQECIAVVDKALSSDPDVRCLKLLLRKSKAYLHLGKIKESFELLKKAQSVLRIVSDNKSKTDVSKFKTEIVECERKITLAFNRGASQRKKDEPKYKKPDIFKNSEFPFASPLITIKKTAEKGRHVIAKKELKFGTVLFTEKPVAFVVVPQYRLYYCNHCCLLIKCPIPCTGCSGLVYCSETCRNSASLYHKYECGGGLSIAYSSPGITHLALRLALIRPLDPAGYARVSSLLHHFEFMAPKNVYELSLTGYALNLYLGEVGFSTSCNTTIDLTLDIGRLIINAHSIDATRTSATPAHIQAAIEAEENVAKAIYPSASMINHSCKSNITDCFNGQYLLVKAKQTIVEGGEIFGSYGVDCFKNERRERRRVLRGQYNFDCDCEACSALVDPYEKFAAFACNKCSGPVINAKCFECSNHQVTSKQTLRELNEANVKFLLAKKYYDRDCSNALKILEEVLETRKLYLYESNKDIGSVYDGIVKCHFALGNYDRGYNMIKEKNIPRILDCFGPNSAMLANAMYHYIILFTHAMLKKYEANSSDYNVQDRAKVNECIKMVEQVEVLYDLYYDATYVRFNDLMKAKHLLNILSLAGQRLLQPKQS